MTMKYTESGLWLQKTEKGYRIGISEKGHSDLGEVMYLELPEFGERIEKGDNLLSVEGSKAVTELAVPMTGFVQDIHKELEDNMDLINSDKPEDNWIVELSNITEINEKEFQEDPWAWED